MLKIIFTLPVVLALLSGCKALPQQDTQNQARAAYAELDGGSSKSNSSQSNQKVQEREDTARYFYATGIGEDIDEARDKALSKIASRISVAVKSTTKTTDLAAAKIPLGRRRILKTS